MDNVWPSSTTGFPDLYPSSSLCDAKKLARSVVGLEGAWTSGRGGMEVLRGEAITRTTPTEEVRPRETEEVRSRVRVSDMISLEIK